MIKKYKNLRDRRRVRIRKVVKGTNVRPRLSVFRSNKNIYAQLIDDAKGITLVCFNSQLKRETDKKDKKIGSKKTFEAKLIGRNLAEEALKKGIKTVVFDRGGYRYHGRIKALAQEAREGGLKF